MAEASNVTRADVNMKFYTRFLLLGIAALGASGWFFKDGLLTWPHIAEVWEAYEELKPESDESTPHHHEEGHEDEAVEHSDDFPQEEWDALVAERGWADSVIFQDGEARQPINRHYSEFDIKTQVYIGILCLPIAAALFWKILRARGLWIESDGQSLTSSWGKGFRYEDVVEINKKKWQNKGLAYVKHQEGGGTRTFIIDDLKFDRQATDAILYEIEQTAGIEKIVGGPPENDPNAEPPADEPEADEAEAYEQADTAAEHN